MGLKFKAWSKVSHRIIEWDIIKANPSILFDYRVYIPMQYTGVIDTKGEEIYKDYLLNIKIVNSSSGRTIIKKTCAVIFKDGCFGVLWGDNHIFTPLKSFSKHTSIIDVVGNIYEEGVK